MNEVDEEYKESFDMSSIDSNMMIMKWKKLELDPQVCVSIMFAVGIASLNELEEHGMVNVDDIITASKKIADLFIKEGFFTRDGKEAQSR